MKTDVLFSRQSDEWATPSGVYDELDREFNFDLDPCATDENHKTKEYFTMREDGLKQPWGGHCVFCNPPYSNISAWVKKASEEANNGATVVLLIPARTDTKWFHKYIYNKAEIRFIKGRLKFGEAKYNAPFPSMIVILRDTKEKPNAEKTAG